MPDQPNTTAAKSYVESRWGIVVGSWRASGSVPNSDHPKGLALDCMTSDLATGNEIETWALSHPEWCKYTIWQRRYKTPQGTNDPYSGPSPHTDHVHISLIAGSTFDGGPGTGPASGGMVNAGLLDTLTAPFAALGAVLSFVTNPGNWLRLGLFILGGGMVVFSLSTYYVHRFGIGGVEQIMDTDLPGGLDKSEVDGD